MSDKKNTIKSTSITTNSESYQKGTGWYYIYSLYLLCFNSFSVQYLKTSL